MTVGGATSHQQHYKKLSLKRKVFLVRRRPRLRQRSPTGIYSILRVSEQVRTGNPYRDYLEMYAWEKRKTELRGY